MIIGKIITTVTNERRHRVLINRRELTDILRDVVAHHVSIDPDLPNVTIKVDIKEETEGSPAYRVGYGAVVEIVEDLRPQATVTVSDERQE